MDEKFHRALVNDGKNWQRSGVRRRSLLVCWKDQGGVSAFDGVRMGSIILECNKVQGIAM